MLSLPLPVRIFVCTQPADMRRSFDGLFHLVRSRLLADPLSGHLFIFRNRVADRLKVLYWGGHGLCLWCQRLEQGRCHFPEPPADATRLELSAGQIPDDPRRHRPESRPTLQTLYITLSPCSWPAVGISQPAWRPLA
jgi:transposase